MKIESIQSHLHHHHNPPPKLEIDNEPALTQAVAMTKIKLENVLRAGLQSGAIMSLADVATQLGIEGATLEDGYRLTRTLRWTVAGLVLHGPYFFVGFSMIDRAFAAQQAVSGITARLVAQKTATAQFVLFPPYLVLLFGFMGRIEGHPNVIEKIQQRAPEAFVSGCVYWPAVNSVNFALVPSTMRVPYLAVSAGIWNSYLSWTNQRGNKVAENKTSTEEGSVETLAP